jgi:predicted AAA+ superfamily ATPase
MSGAIFETYAIVEMLKSYWHQGLAAPFYYYRNKDQREIDLLIERDGMLYPIEIKKSANPDRNALQGIRALEAHGLTMGQGAVLCMVAQPTPLTATVDALPMSVLC